MKANHKGTLLNEQRDIEVSPNEHPLVEVEKAKRAFRKHSVYTRAQIEETLDNCAPYSTIERLVGLKQTAEIVIGDHNKEVMHSEEEWRSLCNRVQAAEDALERERGGLTYGRRQYAALKQKMHNVKTENTNLRHKIDELQKELEVADEYVHDVQSLRGENERLREENEKLRALVFLYRRGNKGDSIS